MRTPGEIIKQARERKGLTQQTLATLAGVKQAHLSRIESGERRLSPGIMHALSAVLEIPFDDLVKAEAEFSGVVSLSREQLRQYYRPVAA